MAKAFHDTDRSVLRVHGPEAVPFLQSVTTNDVRKLEAAPIYAALLTPQGKYLFDFIMVADNGDVLLDVKAEAAASLARRLTMYRLRAKVVIEKADLSVLVGIGEPAPTDALPDPRDAALGWRVYTADPDAVLAGLDALDPTEWHTRRIERVVPETGVELVPDETYILEAGFERLGGVDFKKGCFVGQEVVARMKHKTELKKGLVPVRIDGEAPPPGTEIRTADERPAGKLYSTAGDIGLAYLRFDRAEGEMTAGAARVLRL